MSKQTEAEYFFKERFGNATNLSKGQAIELINDFLQAQDYLLDLLQQNQKPSNPPGLQVVWKNPDRQPIH